MTLHTVILDHHDAVRTQAVRYMERADTITELRAFLKRWHKLALGRKWQGTEAFEIVDRLLKNDVLNK